MRAERRRRVAGAADGERDGACFLDVAPSSAKRLVLALAS